MLYRRIRERLCKKRIYQFGTLGLNHFDDRTLKEKFFDWADQFFIKAKKRVRDTSVWHSYFDHSMGIWIDSPERIREVERKGYSYMKFHEMESACKTIKKANKDAYNKRIRTGLDKKMQQVANGRSFYREHCEAIRKARQ